MTSAVAGWPGSGTSSLLRGLLHRRRLRGDGGDRLVEVEVRAARGAGRDDEATRRRARAATWPKSAEPRARAARRLPVDATSASDAPAGERALPLPFGGGPRPRPLFRVVRMRRGRLRCPRIPEPERPGRRPTAEDSSATGRGARPGGRFPRSCVERLTPRRGMSAASASPRNADLVGRAGGDAERVRARRTGPSAGR